MPDSPHVSINLIGKSKQSFRGDFFKWSVSVGRIIIIVTELIALGALIYRFTIDRKIIDLHDQIEKAEIFVKSQEAKEADYRSIQTRLENIKTTEEETDNKISLMRDILLSISQGNFTSTNLTVDQNRISINGVAFSIFPLNNFIENLKQNENIISISLDEITSISEGIQFKLNVELEDKKELEEKKNQS